jgi:hypothetical protein
MLLAALAFAALANWLPTASIWITAEGIFVMLVPALLGLMQAYDWMRSQGVWPRPRGGRSVPPWLALLAHPKRQLAQE